MPFSKIKMDGIKEECGVAAVALKEHLSEYPIGGAAYFLGQMLMQLQNRGQESAGIVTFNGKERTKLRKHIGVGEVDEVFEVRDRDAYEKILLYNTGTSGIGHVRYSTSGVSLDYGDLIAEAQPFFRQHGRRWKRFALAFNGNLANYKELAEDLENNHGYDLETSVDTEVIMHFLSIDMKRLESFKDGEPDLVDIIKENCKRYDGAYNVVFLNGKGDLVAFKDPYGFKPLVYGENESLIGVASESTALTVLGINKEDIKDIKPGCGILIQGNEMKEFEYAKSNKIAGCVFEPDYFMWDSSVYGKIDGKLVTVNYVRRRLGRELAEIEPCRDIIEKNRDKVIVVPVPNTSIPAAEAYAEFFGLSSVEAIRKKEHGIISGRGFIYKPELRRLVMDNKYDVIGELVEDKIVIVIDDSVVRGDTSSRLVNLLKGCGAAEVHLRSTFPPIRRPCFYGIDFPTLKELVAAPYDSVEECEAEVTRVSGLDSMVYQRIEGLVRALGREDNCLACLNGEYPTEYGRKRFEECLKKD